MTPDLYLLILFLILNAFAIWGFHIATEFEYKDQDYPHLGIVPGSEMVFYKLRIWCIEKLGHHLSKPICTCPTCMSSLHSLYFYAFFMYMVGFDKLWLLFYPLYVLILTGLNYFITLTVKRYA